MSIPRRAFLFRGLALLCACSLSIGSHFGQNTLGPLKSRLSREKGTSNAEFSLLIAALGLNSTWTPLVGGLLAARLGTTWTSLIATSLILAGQLILLLGDLSSSVKTMLFGMFIFGLGISPLAVVQETIIVRFFNQHGLGVSLALGLVAGKGASFVSARTSFPLSEWNPHAPFVVSTLLAAFSFFVNLFYLFASNQIAAGAGVEIEPAEAHRQSTSRPASAIDSVENMSEAAALHKVAEKRTVRLSDLARLGDIFWLYIGINILCGTIWAPFTHLASNIIEHRYTISEGAAAEQASILLVGSVFLYPICGYITDISKKGDIVFRLLILASILTLASYTWLALPPSFTHTALPAMLSFGIGHGFSPLLLVLMVPHLVPLKYVSTALGAHKSLESCGSTVMQTVAGFVLDFKSSNPTRTNADAVQSVLNSFLWLNLAQMAGVCWLRWKEQHSHAASISNDYRQVALSYEEGEHTHQGAPGDEAHLSLLGSPESADSDSELMDDMSAKERTPSEGERRRGRVFTAMSGGAVVSTWLLFVASVWMEMRTT
ncbi:major facilitator superfamily domain-containing protein [Gautieria morchelliformis]|nr:major facilitator superfamily domain-containing protein [Gautieria morchelliformis]